jgi:hypothetical protein
MIAERAEVVGGDRGGAVFGWEETREVRDARRVFADNFVVAGVDFQQRRELAGFVTADEVDFFAGVIGKALGDRG